MFDDFFIRALVAGIGVAFVTGPLGCFVIWRRLSYFGDTLAHSALLGVTLAFTMEFNIAISVFVISSMIALILIQLQKKTNLPGDALLGLLAHSSLAVGLVVIGFLTFIRFDIMGLLFGDILAVSVNDLLIIWIGGAFILLTLKFIWKPLFASTVNYELAEAEGLNPDRAKAIFTILMAAIIAISIKMVGLLLITGMLIIPAAMARNLSSSPQSMVIYSIIGGLLSVIIGLFTSLEFNTSSGPSIITAALLLFILSLFKMVGLLLITGMLIIPAAMARNLSSSPQSMVIYSIIGGLLSVIIGLFTSLEFNTSSGPSIITAALLLFILSLFKIKQSIKLKN